MPSLEDLFARHVAWTSDDPLALTVERAEGPFLYLADGRRIIDFISGIAVSSLGHRHPRVVEAIHRQVDRHLHVMVYFNESSTRRKPLPITFKEEAAE